MSNAPKRHRASDSDSFMGSAKISRARDNLQHGNSQQHRNERAKNYQPTAGNGEPEKNDDFWRLKC